MTSLNDFLRYNRQIMLPEVGMEGQHKIANSKVLVIGAGGLGCVIHQYLAAAGLGTLGILDFDTVEIHNLHRQILYKDTHIGKSKAIAAREVLAAQNPNVNLLLFDEKLTERNAVSILEQFDIIVDGSDNFSTRYLVNDICVNLQKPLIYGTIFKFQGQFAVFNYQSSKNLRDLFPEPPSAHDVPNCSENGVLGTLPGVLGTMMAHETLKLICDMEVLRNQLVLFDTHNWNFKKVNF